MKTGALAMFDALGVKEIWEKHDPKLVIEKFERLDGFGRALIDRDYGGPGHPRLDDQANCIEMVRVGFLSDTVVVAVVNKGEQKPAFATMMAARYAGDLQRLGLGLAPAWTYRGVITYGRFEIHRSGNFFVGPAVDLAATNHERADAAVVWLDDCAQATLREAAESDFQGAVTRALHDVPLKNKCGECVDFRTRVVSPFPFGCAPDTAQEIVSAMLATFDETKPGVPAKRQNTKTIFSKHLEEHAKLWADSQALLKSLGL